MTEVRDGWTMAQQSVLGAALIEPTLVPKIIREMRSSDFNGPQQTVFNVMHKLFLAGTPVDVVSVSGQLGHSDYTSFLVQLMEITPTAAHLDSYMTQCREQAKLRQVQSIAVDMQNCTSSEEIRKLLEKANGLMVDKTSLKITTMSTALQSFMERHTGTVKYLSWPIRELNDRLYADAGDFILVGGYPSSGKSAWALQCAWHWAKDMKVGFFSLETSSEKLFDRQMASVVEGLSMDNIKRNQINQSGWDRITAQAGEITARNLELIPAAGMSPADIRSVTMMRGYKIILIDYIQLLQSTGENRTAQVTNISLALHRMAQDMQVTVVALSQLKRKNDDSSPENSDLRESGQLEQDADIIMILKLKDREKPGGPRDLYITKNKEGTCPKIALDFDGKTQTFRKANQNGEIIEKMKADARKAKAKNKKAQQVEQFSLLSPSTPVPFTDD